MKRVVASLALLLSACAAPEAAVILNEERAELRAIIPASAGVELPAGEAEEIATARAILQTPLTGESLRRLVFLRNPEVRAHLLELGVARMALLQAGRVMNPSLGGSARWFDEGPEIEVGLAQAVVSLFMVPLREAESRAELHARRAEIADRLVRLSAESQLAALELAGAQRRIALREARRDAAAEAVQLMGKLEKAGNALAIDSVGEDLALSRARLDLARAERMESVAREAVNRLASLWGSEASAWTASELLPLAPELDLDRVESLAVSANFELRRRRFEAEALLVAAGIATDSVWSELTLGPAAQREPEGDWGVGGEFNVPLPLLDDGGAKALSARFEAEARLERHTAAAIAMRSEARRLRDVVEALRAELRFLRESHLPLQHRFTVLTLQNYNAMQVGVFEVMRARQNELAAEDEALETELELRREEWRLWALLNGVHLGGSSGHEASTMPPRSETMPTRKEH